MTRETEPPSGYALIDLTEGKPGSLARTAGLTVLRAGIIAPGLYFAGERRHLVKKSVAASVSITVLLLAWYATRRST